MIQLLDFGSIRVKSLWKLFLCCSVFIIHGRTASFRHDIVDLFLGFTWSSSYLKQNLNSYGCWSLSQVKIFIEGTLDYLLISWTLHAILDKLLVFKGRLLGLILLKFYIWICERPVCYWCYSVISNITYNDAIVWLNVVTGY